MHSRPVIRSLTSTHHRKGSGIRNGCSHDGVPKGYVVNSLFHRSVAAILNGGQQAKAYQYTPGGKWALYNCEQQATIVNHWFDDDCSSSHANYVYITTNIRPGNPWA